MNDKVKWTMSHARLRRVNDCVGLKHYNWLFIPGGPGLGSESLIALTDILNLPGTTWHFDFPGDGSNVSDANEAAFSNWRAALIESTKEFENLILVAHSSGGMFVLATPEIEKNISGLILMDSAPDSGWQSRFSEYVDQNPIAEAGELQKLYQKRPSNDLLKKLTIASTPYFSLKQNSEKVIKMLEKLPFNYESQLWAERNFDQNYKAKWVPEKIPTLIFSGDQDHITSTDLFSRSEKFQRKNILIRKIKAASHFPWLDNPQSISQLFLEYVEWVESKG